MVQKKIGRISFLFDFELNRILSIESAMQPNPSLSTPLLDRALKRKREEEQPASFNVIVYTRQSSDRPSGIHGESTSRKTQLALCKKAAKDTLGPCTKTRTKTHFSEVTSGGPTGNQRELARLINECRRTTNAVVFVFSPDRLTRCPPRQTTRLIPGRGQTTDLSVEDKYPGLSQLFIERRIYFCHFTHVDGRVLRNYNPSLEEAHLAMMANYQTWAHMSYQGFINSARESANIIPIDPEDRENICLRMWYMKRDYRTIDEISKILADALKEQRFYRRYLDGQFRPYSPTSLLNMYKDWTKNTPGFDNVPCYCCGKNDRTVLLCDGCNVYCMHYKCLGFDTEPDEIYCKHCIRDQGGQDEVHELTSKLRRL